MPSLSRSPHAIPDRLRLRVNRISLQEYDRLQYDKERLRDICERAACASLANAAGVVPG